jgi:hypothetical protein
MGSLLRKRKRNPGAGTMSSGGMENDEDRKNLAWE